MKVVIALFLLTFTCIASAGDRAIYDLMYLPKAGTIFGSTNAAFITGKATQHEDTSGDIADLKYSGYGVFQSVGFSLMDSLFISGSMSYQGVDIKADIDGGDNETYTYNGISDPSLAARCRVIDSEYLLDVLAGATIATGDAKDATVDKDGNNKTGGYILNLALEFGKKVQDSQYAFQLGATRNFEATEKSSGLETKSNAHMEYNLRGSMLQGLTENTFINPFVEMTITNAFHDDRGTKNQQTTSFDLGAEYQYLLSQNLLLKAGIKYTNTENAVIDTTETREDILLTFLAGANYQF